MYVKQIFAFFHIFTDFIYLFMFSFVRIGVHRKCALQRIYKLHGTQSVILPEVCRCTAAHDCMGLHMTHEAAHDPAGLRSAAGYTYTIMRFLSVALHMAANDHEAAAHDRMGLRSAVI